MRTLRNEGKSGIRARRWLLAVLAVGLVYAGWMPMDFQLAGAAEEATEALTQWQFTRDSLLNSSDVQLNLLLFIPVGLLAGWIWGVNLFSALAAAGISAAVSLTIEAGQLFLPERFACMRDVLTNTAGGLIGWTLGLPLFFAPLRRRWRALARWLGTKYGLLGAAMIASGLAAQALWNLRVSGWVLWRNAGRLADSPMGDPQRFTHLRWLTLGLLPYLAMTLLLSSRRADRKLTDGRIFLAGACSLAVLGVCELLRLFNPDEGTGLAALLLGWVGVMLAIPLAPVLHRRRVDLPEIVLAGEILFTMLLVRVAWSAGGGGTRWPLWGLYQHEFAWGYFALSRRLAFMAMVGFMGAFYLSLKRHWPMRARLLAAAIGATTAAAVIELAKFLTGGEPNLAGLGEHAAAAVTGTLIFAICWTWLDRRRNTAAAQLWAAAGLDRRHRS